MTRKAISKSRYWLVCAGKVLDLSEQPAIMGIVNLTPDSFYYGARFSTTTQKAGLDKALESALRMVQAGASIIDAGGESTRPGASRVSASEEIDRTLPFIELLRKNSDVLISIDTWKAEVAEAALRAGASLVNDISGLTFDPSMADTCGRYRCGIVLMHTPARPEHLRWSQDTRTKQRDIVRLVSDFLEQSIKTSRSHGIESIIIDPGLGFGKSVEENFQLIARLDELHEFGYPVLAGLSRKSFLGQAMRKRNKESPPPDERLNATISANTIALMNGADILRVHDVEAAADARSVILALRDAVKKQP
ncbi:MAG: dihydropteroate synthase [Chlorobiaceae bacterium]|nr:dihydropteroate synthase [Chlorobiaceae bacterium]